MTLHLMKNGEVLSERIVSPDHPLPSHRHDHWQDCTVVATERVEARPSDRLDIVVNSRPGIPFMFSRCRLSVTGWEVEGKVLYK